MAKLIHLIYASVACKQLDARALQSILVLSRSKNVRAGITGMLLHVDGSLFQVLEGDENAVQDTFTRIAGDNRHQQATCIICEPIAKRAFAEWTMGYASLPCDQGTKIAGSNDFFDGQNCLSNLDSGRARKLLQAFSAGRWRTRLNPPQSVAA